MTQPLPPQNGLRAFEAAARHGSFTRAADELHVTQTAISHQIRKLEEQLGVRLFVRSTRRMRRIRSARTAPLANDALTPAAETMMSIHDRLTITKSNKFQAEWK